MPARRDADDDAATSDAFTLLLLAASTADDAQPGDESRALLTGDVPRRPMRPTRGDPAAPVLRSTRPSRPRAPRRWPPASCPLGRGRGAGHANPFGNDVPEGRARGGDARALEAATAAGRPALADQRGAGRCGIVVLAAVDLALGAPPTRPTGGEIRLDTLAAADARAERTSRTLRRCARLAPMSRAPACAGRAARDQAYDRACRRRLTRRRPVTPLSATASRIADIRPPLALEVTTPAFAPGWQDEAVGRMAHVVVTRNERAELTLHPAELGPVSIRVEMQADQASLTIVAACAETRSALEQSLPQLRDLLAGQGITLGQASVHDGQARRDDSRRRLASVRRARAPRRPRASGRIDLVGAAGARPGRRLRITARTGPQHRGRRGRANAPDCGRCSAHAGRGSLAIIDRITPNPPPSSAHRGQDRNPRRAGRRRAACRRQGVPAAPDRAGPARRRRGGRRRRLVVPRSCARGGEAKPAAAKPPVFHTLEPFTVNLSRRRTAIITCRSRSSTSSATTRRSTRSRPTCP